MKHNLANDRRRGGGFLALTGEIISPLEVGPKEYVPFVGMGSTLKCQVRSTSHPMNLKSSAFLSHVLTALQYFVFGGGSNRGSRLPESLMSLALQNYRFWAGRDIANMIYRNHFSKAQMHEQAWSSVSQHMWHAMISLVTCFSSKEVSFWIVPLHCLGLESIIINLLNIPYLCGF